jgi:hypothetical protein
MADNKEVTQAATNGLDEDVKAMIASTVSLLQQDEYVYADFKAIWEGIQFTDRKDASDVRRATVKIVQDSISVTRGYIVKNFFMDFVRDYYLAEKEITLDTLKESVKEEILLSINRIVDIVLNKINESSSKSNMTVLLAQTGFIDTLEKSLRAAVHGSLEDYWRTR